MNWLDQHFGVTAKGSTLRTEFLAGFATFLTMAYIIVVNPAILSTAGLDFGAVFVATIVAAMVGSAIMGFWANRSEEHTSELQSHHDLVCRLLLEKKKSK